MSRLSVRRTLQRPQVRRIAGNTVWLMSERVARGLVAVLVTAAVARYLGASQFGILSYALSFVLLFSTLWTLGLSGLVVRELVRKPYEFNETLGTLFVLRGVGGLIGVALIVVAANLVGLDNDLARTAIAILAVATLFHSFDGIDFWFQSQVRSRYEVTARLVALAVTAATNVMLIVVQAPLIAFVFAVALEHVVAGVSLVAVYSWTGQSVLRWRPTMAKARFLLSASWPLLLSGAFSAINLRIDQIMLGNMAGAAEVGTYAAAARLSEIWYFVPTAIAASVFPALLHAREASRQAYERRQQQLYDLMALISIPIALAVSLLSPILVHVIYGPEFASSALVLSIHVWAGPFVFMAAILSKWLVAENLLKFSFIRHGAGALTNVVLNLLLIPQFGGVGSAIATLVSYAVASHLASFAYRPTWGAARRMTLALAAPPRYLLAAVRQATR
ncbi:MAG TPA: flippase [Candidatus Limnocylindria bacterium]